MGIRELRQISETDKVTANLQAQELVRTGHLSEQDAALVQTMRDYCDASVDRILYREGLVQAEDLHAFHAAKLGSRRLSGAEILGMTPYELDLDPRLLLKYRVLPVVDPQTGRPALACAQLETLPEFRCRVPGEIALAPVLLAPLKAVQTAVAQNYREGLVQEARTRTPLRESCRNWSGRLRRRVNLTILSLIGIALAVVFAPQVVFSILAIWAVATLLVSGGVRIAAVIASRTGMKPARQGQQTDLLPKVSILVPLFHETEILHTLIARLNRLTYPKCLLDVVIVLEENDTLTRKMLAGIDLPLWVRAVVVPEGQPRTKPRAMNYALDFCDGDIIGIFDAEDAPDPDQITVMARYFMNAPADIACVQAVLDYYNSTQNWLARCFTIEYAAWFRTILPGMARLGFAIPLGGTSLYFRRDVLEELGGWDAHNVTEDADLGFRLARHGYRTEMIGTVTEEEANCHIWPWIKQRSRWLKGYMTTYLVHMRAPRALYRELGHRQFWGFQAHFLACLSQVLLAPVLWSFWLVLLGLPHPLDPVLPKAVMVGLGSLFLLVEVINLTIYLMSVATPKHRHLIPWVPLMHFYLPLNMIAAYRALYELILKPFYWEKTTHGISRQLHTRNRWLQAAVNFTRIKLKPGYKRL